MRIPTWRLALAGGAIVILVGVGVGLVAASSGTPAAATAPAAAAPSVAPGTAGGAAGSLRERIGQRVGRAMAGRPFARHLVHATVTVTDKEGNLVNLQLDHGTIVAIGSGTLSIAEKGGATVTVSTDAKTVVFLGGGAGKGSLGDLRVGDEVFVQSRIDGGTTLAKHLLRLPASTAG